MCLPHDFMDKLFMDLLMIPLLPIIIPIQIAACVAVKLKNLAIFGVMVPINLTKKVVSTAVNYGVVKPAYFISYPFRKMLTQREQIQPQKLIFTQEEKKEFIMRIKKIMSNNNDQICILIKEAKIGKKENDLKMVGSLPKAENLAAVINFLKKNLVIGPQESVQLFCNQKLLQLEMKLQELPKNQSGVVELFFLKMETFG